MTRKPNLSIPIDEKLNKRIQQEVKRTGLSKADVVRQALRIHFGVLAAK